MSGRPANPAKDVVGNSAAFVDFTRAILSVPHSAIKAKLDAEKQAKRTPKTGRAKSSRVSVARRPNATKDA